ncbi:hypothetical protein HK101_008953 [Irineochytrium annulatum]|nr:hypothetical protein HK101_008953 [Irineochytrium annulatum]
MDPLEDFIGESDLFSDGSDDGADELEDEVAPEIATTATTPGYLAPAGGGGLTRLGRQASSTHVTSPGLVSPHVSTIAPVLDEEDSLFASRSFLSLADDLEEEEEDVLPESVDLPLINILETVIIEPNVDEFSTLTAGNQFAEDALASSRERLSHIAISMDDDLAKDSPKTADATESTAKTASGRRNSLNRRGSLTRPSGNSTTVPVVSGTSTFDSSQRRKSLGGSKSTASSSEAAEDATPILATPTHSVNRRRSSMAMKAVDSIPEDNEALPDLHQGRGGAPIGRRKSMAQQESIPEDGAPDTRRRMTPKQEMAISTALPAIGQGRLPSPPAAISARISAPSSQTADVESKPMSPPVKAPPPESLQTSLVQRIMELQRQQMAPIASPEASAGPGMAAGVRVRSPSTRRRSIGGDGPGGPPALPVLLQLQQEQQMLEYQRSLERRQAESRRLTAADGGIPIDALPRVGPNPRVLEQARKRAKDPTQQVAASVGYYEPWPLMWAGKVTDPKKRDEWKRQPQERFPKIGGGVGPAEYNPKAVKPRSPEGHIAFKNRTKRFPPAVTTSNVAPGTYRAQRHDPLYDEKPDKSHYEKFPFIVAIQKELNRRLAAPIPEARGSHRMIMEQLTAASARFEWTPRTEMV